MLYYLICFVGGWVAACLFSAAFTPYGTEHETWDDDYAPASSRLVIEHPEQRGSMTYNKLLKEIR